MNLSVVLDADGLPDVIFTPRDKHSGKRSAGRRVATGSVDGKARLWEAAPGADRSRGFDIPRTGPAVAVAFSPSGRHLAVGLGNGLIAIMTTPPAPAR
jgi:hypothetical protein